MRYFILLLAFVSFSAFAQQYVDFPTFRAHASANDPAFKSLSVDQQLQVYREARATAQLSNPATSAQAQQTLDEIHTEDQMKEQQQQVHEMQQKIDQLQWDTP